MLERRSLLSSLALAAFIPEAAFGSPNATLGVLTPFYRSTQLQGHLFGMGLMEIPSYLLGDDIDLRYKKNPKLAEEIPFADSFSIVRFLGGYKLQWLDKYREVDLSLGKGSLDYVVRDQNGNLEYRPIMIRDRLAPYLEAGYEPKDMALGLDNVPWAIAAPSADGKGEGYWGQKNPPSDMQLWSTVISHFGLDLTAYLGSSASDVSFETGIEYDERVSFSASEEIFFDYYFSTFRGISSAIPQSKLSPGEFTGLGECSTAATCVYDSQKLLLKARRSGIPITTMPRSLYGTWLPKNGLPSSVVRRATISYARLPKIVPEIHQFGLIGQPFSSTSGSDPAAAQASWQFQTLIGLWIAIKPRRVFHWGGFTSIGRKSFLNGPGFLRLVLDRYVGCQMIKIPISEYNGAFTGNSEKIAVLFYSEKKVGIMISSFSLESSTKRSNIVLTLPVGFAIPSSDRIRSVRYNSSTNVFSAIRRDLADANNLQKSFVICPNALGEPLAMAVDANAARVLVEKKWPYYVSVMKNGLRWNKDNDVSSNKDQIRAEIESNELIVLEFPRI